MPGFDIRRLLNRISNLLRQIEGWLNLLPLGPGVSGFTPTEGWPGTIMQISGHGFSANRDDNLVRIGGSSALVIEAEPNRLLVLAGESTLSGPVSVTVGGSTATAVQLFKVLPYPTTANVLEDGPPVFFHGPLHGTPSTHVQNQRVLVIMSFPTDQDPGAGGAAIRADLINRFGQAGQYWQQASFGSTTWAFESTGWVALPNDRRFYFWQQEDVDDARKALIEQSSRAVAVTGTTVYVGSGNGLVPIDYSNPMNISFSPGAALGQAASAIRVAGARAYATAGSSGFHVIDITSPLSPHVLGSAGGAGWGADLDVAATTAVVAAREAGLLVFDVSNPASPAQVGALPLGADWATAVRIAGSKAYVGSGTKLVVVDISTPANPISLASVDLGSWVMDVDVSGTLCAVATDGDGLHLFDISGAAPIEQSTFRSALRLRGVTLAGTEALVAAEESGLLLLDVSNPANPAKSGSVTTSLPAFTVTASGTTAFIGAGSFKLTSVNIATVASPTVIRSDDVGGGTDLDLNGLRDQLRIASDSQALVKDGDVLMLDALAAGQATLPSGTTVNDFQGFIVMINGPFLRGQSWTTGGFSRNARSLQFNETKGVIYLSPVSTWGRFAHEIGHWLGMWDIYTEWYSDGTYLPGSAADWCLSGNHDLEPLFCAHQIHEKMRFFDLVTPNVNVVELDWSPTAPGLNQTYEIVAHDANEDTTPDRIHILKLKVADGLIYYVEVRQTPMGPSFDQHIAIPAGQAGVVLVTRVTDGTSISNTQERPIEVFEILTPGQQAVDAARDLIIRYESVVQDRPLVSKVRVQWNQPVAGDPNGRFDMFVTPWDTSTWETVDIWVDSPRNNNGGQTIYENHEPNNAGAPILGGDRPWVHHKNKIYTRIRNTGPAAVPDVYVTCYVTSPPGIGDNGDWATLATQHVTNFPGHDPAVAGSGEQIIEFDWIPAVDKHTCLKVAILPEIGEIETDNNLAQENVAHFDSASASSHQPVILDAEVRSPFIVGRKVDLVARAIPPGWHVVIDHAWQWLAGRATKPVRAVIWTDYGTGAGREKQTPPAASPKIEGWTTFDHRYLPIGGILAMVKAVQKVTCKGEVGVRGSTLYAVGCLEPPLAGVPVTVEVIDEHGSSELYHGSTDANGCYSIEDQKALVEPGVYTVQVFVTAGGGAAESECEATKVAVR
jgi:hypothetical protein